MKREEEREGSASSSFPFGEDKGFVPKSPGLDGTTNRALEGTEQGKGQGDSHTV